MLRSLEPWKETRASRSSAAALTAGAGRRGSCGVRARLMVKQRLVGQGMPQGTGVMTCVDRMPGPGGQSAC